MRGIVIKPINRPVIKPNKKAAIKKKEIEMDLFNFDNVPEEMAVEAYYQDKRSRTVLEK